MTKREKILLYIVCGLVVSIGGLYFVNKLIDGFESREDQLVDLQMRKADLDTVVLRGTRAKKQLKEYVARSLPSNLDYAESAYLTWLESKVDAVGFADRDVTSGARRPVGDLYHQHVFNVRGRADYGQVLTLLYELHSVELLHRVGHLSLKPVRSSKRLLDVQMTIHAVSMRTAEETFELNPQPSEDLMAMDLQGYVDSIVARNFFSPANNPPRITSSSSQRGYVNRPVSFTVRASDDDGDEVSYALDGELPEGARIDEKSGSVRFTPKEEREYHFVVKATDRGVPPKSATQDVTVAITQAPPPPPPAPPRPGFDVATQTVLTGITESAGQRIAWVTIKTEGKVLWVAEGEKISVGSVKGVLKKLTNNDAEIEVEGGETLKIRIGKSFRADDAGAKAAAGG